MLLAFTISLAIGLLFDTGKQFVLQKLYKILPHLFQKFILQKKFNY